MFHEGERNTSQAAKLLAMIRALQFFRAGESL